MTINISWKLTVQVQSGPDILIASTVQADAYERIEARIPDTSGSTTAPPTTIDVQPGAVKKIKLLLIRSTRYGDDLKYQVHDNTTPVRILNDAVFLVGAGSLDLLEGSTVPLDKLLVTNTTGHEVVLEIIVGRSAV
jgi:hypothetical protein